MLPSLQRHTEPSFFDCNHIVTADVKVGDIIRFTVMGCGVTESKIELIENGSIFILNGGSQLIRVTNKSIISVYRQSGNGVSTLIYSSANRTK